MGLFLRHREGSCEWAVWKMDESVEELMAFLPSVSRAVYEKDIRSFTSEHRKMERLAVRALLFALLGEAKEIGYEANGRPYLKDHSYHVSFSHTKGYVAVILNSEIPVGIDIEQYGQRIHRISGRFLHPGEQVFPYQGDFAWGLLLHWSAKESVYKCMKEADADLRKLCLSHFSPQKEGTLLLQEHVTARQRIYTVGYYIHADFVLTWIIS